ncbi:MAG: Gfo/Idh/MocA family oxidoreductase [Hyphomicrobiales bacterium]|nr:Gfo/Idh/MocA family oxidoreductase [Hyphomicrobiales bacterium]
MKTLGIGLVGSGFMGRSHAYAFRAADAVFDLPVRPSLEVLADIDDNTAAKAAPSLGFARSTGDWKALIADPAVDLVDITAPNALHKPIALAAIEAGKPVYCEKPLAPNAAEAGQMVDAAERNGVMTAVGFNYLKNPMVALAREIVDSGEIGEIISFRGIHAEDYMADPSAPHTWRLEPAGGHGVVADLGSHIISIARHIAGPITSVVGQIATVVAERPVRPGASETRPVEVDDQARALIRFDNGATGSIEASWVSPGRKMTLAFEITGTKGTIFVDHERMSELQLYTSTGQAAGRQGFKTILAGPEHSVYGAFCPAPGHQLGFNDIKTIEARALMLALADGPPFQPDFREAWEIQRVVDAIVLSARESRWLTVTDI